MIRSVQTEAAGAITLTREGTAQVEGEVKSAQEAGRTLQEIVGVVSRVTDEIREIATAAEQQGTVASQVAAHVEGLAGISRRTATGVQQSAQATQSLSKLATEMRSLVGRFKL